MEKNESSQFLKRELWLLASVSLFSLLLCYSLGFFYFEPVSFHVYLSTFAFSFLTRTIDRKYMFLVCNGILVFLARSSTSISSSSPPLSGLSGKSSETADQIKTSVDDDFVAEDQEQHEEEEEVVETEVEEGGDLSLYAENEEGKNAEDFIKGDENSCAETKVMDATEEEELSTDELNKKFEEFIRKMKEEIRIEAQQQLVAV